MNLSKTALIKIGIASISTLTIINIIQNLGIKTTKYKIYSKKLPTEFDNYKIAFLSDIHSRNFGEKQKKLIKKVKKIKPNIILITGDWVDSKHGKFINCIEQANLLSEIAPVWCVYGNHEIRIIKREKNDNINHSLSKAGANFLHKSNIKIKRKNSYINLVGIEDEIHLKENAKKQKHMINTKIMLEHATNRISPNNFTILMAHRPEFMDIYSNFDIDLVLSGHAHGGQIRLPFIGGLFAPKQGIFPKLTSGIHEKNKTKMIINRGLGGFKPFRVFNKPEVVSIVLNCEKQKKLKPMAKL